MFFNSIWCNLVFSTAADDNLISQLPQSLPLCFVLLAAWRTCCWDVSDEILRLWFELAYIISIWSCSENIYPSQSTTVASRPTCRASFLHFTPSSVGLYLRHLQIQLIHTLSLAGNSLKNTNMSSGGEHRSFLFNYRSLLADSASVHLIYFERGFFLLENLDSRARLPPVEHGRMLHFQSTHEYTKTRICWGNPVD